MQRLLRFLETPLGRRLRAAVSLALLIGFAWGIDWRELASLRGRFDWGAVLGATLLAGAAYPLQAWRWWRLLRLQDVAVSAGWAQRVTWIGQFYNAFLPGGLGGDAVRAYYACRDAPDRRAGALAALAMDRILGFALLLLLALAALAARAGSLSQDAGLRGVFLASLLCLALGMGLVGLLLRHPPRRWPLAWRERLGAVRVQLWDELWQRFRRAPGELAFAALLSIAVWGLDFVALWWLAAAVGLNVPFLEMCVAAAVAYAAAALPISFGGHGVREGALLGTLALFGWVSLQGPAREPALTLALLSWIVSVAWSLIGATGWWFERRARRSQPN